MKKEFKIINESSWDYAACDNPKCPRHPQNSGEANKHYAMYSNGKNTYCDVCVKGD